jgi:hypothetical protein
VAESERHRTGFVPASNAKVAPVCLRLANPSKPAARVDGLYTSRPNAGRRIGPPFGAVNNRPSDVDRRRRRDEVERHELRDRHGSPPAFCFGAPAIRRLEFLG